MHYYSHCCCAAAATRERIGARWQKHRRIKKAGTRRAVAISLFSLLAVVDFVRTWMDRERYLFLSFSQEGSSREFFSLFYLVCTRLSVLSRSARLVAPTANARDPPLLLDMCSIFGNTLPVAGERIGDSQHIRATTGRANNARPS